MYILEQTPQWSFDPVVGKLIISGKQLNLEQFAEIRASTENYPIYNLEESRTAIKATIVGTDTEITFEDPVSHLPADERFTVLIFDPDPATVAAGPSSNVAVTNFPYNQLVTVTNPESSPIYTELSSSASGGFGEALTAEITPLGQYEAIYGLGGDMAPEYETFNAFGGLGGTENSAFVARSSLTQYSYGVLRSKRFLRYRPGQSATARFTAMFTAGIASTSQRAGLFNQESAFMVGYNGTEFGVLHSYGGEAAIATLTITGAPTTSTNATVTVNDANYSVALVAGETVEQTASRIAAQSYVGWNVQQFDNKVVFASRDTSPKLGSFLFSHADATATFALDKVGTPPTDNWIPQASWSVDPLNGSGPSGMTIDPTKLNVFQIRYKWLGAGSVSFMVENQANGKLVEFHRLIWTNQNTTPHIGNPSLKVGYVAYNLAGGLGTQVEVKGYSMMLGVDGKRALNHYPRSVSVSKSGLSNDNTDPDDIHHILTILNPLIIDGKINTRELVLNSASLSATASKPTDFLVYLNANLLGGVTNTFRSLPETSAYYCTVDGEIDGTLYTPLTVSALVGGGQTGGQKDLDLNQYNIVIPAGSKVSICARSSTNITELTAALTWTLD